MEIGVFPVKDGKLFFKEFLLACPLSHCDHQLPLLDTGREAGGEVLIPTEEDLLPAEGIALKTDFDVYISIAVVNF